MQTQTHSHTLDGVDAVSPPQGGVEEEGGSRVLKFDERTMKKARRRQGNEPRVCSRRYLRVDFADIGWSEWVLAPKAFEAFYCAGTCRFPIPKVREHHMYLSILIQNTLQHAGISESPLAC